MKVGDWENGQLVMRVETLEGWVDEGIAKEVLSFDDLLELVEHCVAHMKLITLEDGR